MKSIIALLLLLFTSLCFSQSNVVSTKYTYYERVYVFPTTTKVDPTVYKKYEIKVFQNLQQALDSGLGLGDYYALPPVNNQSFIVKITQLPVVTTNTGSIENTSSYMSRELIEN